MRSLLFFLALALPALATAQVPEKLGYQGRLLNADGIPETGIQKLTFSLFANETGAAGETPLWTEEQSLFLSDGYYATFLGEVKPLGGVFDGSDRFLEVAVNGSTLSPRQRISSVPYALVCTDARNLKGGTVNASSISVASGGNISIGGTPVIDSSGQLAPRAISSVPLPWANVSGVGSTTPWPGTVPWANVTGVTSGTQWPGTVPWSNVTGAPAGSGSVSVKDFGAKGDGVTDDTAAVQAAFDAVLSLGNRNSTTNTLRIPPGDYRVTALTLGYLTGALGTAATKDVYYKNVVAEGKLVGTNATGPVLDIEGMIGVNFYSLRVLNTSTAPGSLAARAARSYAVNWFGGQFSGGEVAFKLQGNNNNFFGTAFTYSGTGFLIAGNTADTLANTLWGCDIEANTRYGVNVDRASGTLPSLAIRNSYFEAGAAGFLAHVRVSNALDVAIDGNYFAFNISHDGVLYAGTLALATPADNRNAVTNNYFQLNTAALKVNCIAREAGTPDAVMRFVRYGNNAVSGFANPNTVLGVAGAYPGSANSGMTYSINLEGQRRAVYINNFDFSALSAGAGSAPTGWTNGGGAAIASGATISPYGYGNKLLKPNQYAYQDITVRPNTLYYLSAWADVDATTSTAQVQLWNSALTSLRAATTSNSTTSPALLEGWYFSAADTTLRLLLRNTAAGPGQAGFSELRMIDYTN